MSRYLPQARPRRRSRAFTLIELIVVVVILGLLAGVGAFAYNQVTESSHKHSARMMANHIARDGSGISAAKQQPLSALVTSLEVTEDLIGGDAAKSGISIERGTAGANGDLYVGVLYHGYCTPVLFPGIVAKATVGTTRKAGAPGTCKTDNGTPPAGDPILDPTAGDGGSGDPGGTGGTGGTGDGGGSGGAVGSCSKGTVTSVQAWVERDRTTQYGYVHLRVTLDRVDPAATLRVRLYWRAEVLDTTDPTKNLAFARTFDSTGSNESGGVYSYASARLYVGARITTPDPAFVAQTMFVEGAIDAVAKSRGYTLSGSDPSEHLPANGFVGVTDPSNCMFYFGPKAFDKAGSTIDEPAG